MGCCENYKNLLGYQNKASSSSSSSLMKLKETNLSGGKKTSSPILIDNVLKTLLRAKTPQLTLKKPKKLKVLDKINEEESEYVESSMNRQKMMSKEKILDLRNSIKKDKSKTNNIKIENIKILRKNRSHPKFKTKLNEEMFIKKLNEYKNNKSKRNLYISSLSYLSQLKESKSERLLGSLYEKSGGDSSFKESINKINKEKKNKIINRNKINLNYNMFSKSKDKSTVIEYYEEEINKNSLQHHIPKSIPNIFFKPNMMEDDDDKNLVFA